MDLPRLTNLCSALSVSSRSKIFFTLLEASEPLQQNLVSELTETTGTVCSHHLKILAESGLVIKVQQGKYSLFTVDKKTLYEFVYFLNTLLTEGDYAALDQTVTEGRSISIRQPISDSDNKGNDGQTGS